MNVAALVSAAQQLLGESRSDDELDSSTVKFQRCTQCSYVRFPEAPLCPECLNDTSEWIEDSGIGTLWSFCVYRRAFDKAFEAALPYNVALIELDSGPRIVSNVLGVEESELHIGLRVIAEPREIVSGRSLIYFKRHDEDKSQ